MASLLEGVTELDLVFVGPVRFITHAKPNMRYPDCMTYARDRRCLVWDPALIGERERRIIRATWPEEEAA